MIAAPLAEDAADSSRAIVVRTAPALLAVCLLASCTDHAPAPSSLSDVAAGLRACAGASARAIEPGLLLREGVRTSCLGAIYIQSDLMPLSKRGVGELGTAARTLGIDSYVLDASELYDWLGDAATPFGGGDATRPLATWRDSVAAALIAAGGTLHFPSVLIHRGGRIAGDAILGYKKSAAYERMIGQRLASDRLETGREGAFEPGIDSPAWSQDVSWRDHRVAGRPGAYFRWVPGTNLVAFEIAERIALLDVITGATASGPGFVDFIPSPDGRIFVTPAPDQEGLEFYDARAVVRAAGAGDGRQVRRFAIDRAMRDQYPSVGMLSDTGIGAAREVTYRVLTSWFDGAVFRDYRVSLPPDPAGAVAVHPVSGVSQACAGQQISLPIIAPTGRELAARDESTGTTKLFELDERGSCREALDLGIGTGKVAFSGNARRIAFAVPPDANPSGRDLQGVFTFDRARLLVSKVPGSAVGNRFTIPEFVGDHIAFLIAPARGEQSSRFRVVQSRVTAFRCISGSTSALGIALAGFSGCVDGTSAVTATVSTPRAGN